MFYRKSIIGKSFHLFKGQQQKEKGSWKTYTKRHSVQKVMEIGVWNEELNISGSLEYSDYI